MTNQPPFTSAPLYGFTIIELLITLAVLGILLGIVGPILLSWRSKQDADSFLASLASDLNASRTRAIATGQARQIRLLDAKSYTVENQAVGASTWTTVRTVSTGSNVLDLTNTLGRTYNFKSVGFVTVTTSAGTTASTYDIKALNGTGQKSLSVTALGLVRRQ